MKNIKIVYVVHEFPPDPVWGTSIGCFQLAKEMLARGHKVCVLAPQLWESEGFPSIGFFDEKVDGLSVRRLVFNPLLAANPVLYEYYNPVLCIYAKDFLREISPDVVHIYHLLRLSSSMIDAAKELGIPVVLTLSDFWFFCPTYHRLKPDGSLCTENFSWKECISCLREGNSLYDRIREAFDEKKMEFYIQKELVGDRFKLARMNNSEISSLLVAAAGRLSFLKRQLEKVDRIACFSSFLSKVFLEKGYFRNGFRVVTPGTICPVKSGLRKGQNSNITFGYFGGGRKTKGAHILIEAFRGIESDKAKLNLYGDFQDTEYVKELYRMANGDERITFMGSFERTELTKVLAGIDILVMPSICYEVYGLAILEACVNKVPVIATDIGGMPEIVHNNVNGLLFKRGDVLDLKQKMERVINEPGLIQKFRENMPDIKSVSEECDEYLDIYKELLR